MGNTFNIDKEINDCRRLDYLCINLIKFDDGLISHFQFS